jgi:hypothetical protein
MPLTKVSFSVIQVANNVTSKTVGNTTSIPSITFDQNGVITAVSNNTLSVANTSITGNIISSQIAPNVTLTTPIISGNLNLDSAGTTGIRVPSANTLAFHTAGTEDMRITSDGKVGIGATSPAAILDVGSSVTQSGSAPTNIYSDLRINAASTGIASILNPRVVGLAGSYTIAGAAGVYVAPFVMQTGVVATNTYGVYIGDVGDGGAGGSVTNKYAIYQAASGNINYFAGTLQFNNGYGSVATAYGCRAWVNFNGVGTIAIRASGNVSSLTDNGTGDYTLNFATGLVDNNYAAIFSGMRDSDNNGSLNTTALKSTTYGNTVSTGSIRVLAENDSGTRVDPLMFTAAFFR